MKQQTTPYLQTTSHNNPLHNKYTLTITSRDTRRTHFVGTIRIHQSLRDDTTTLFMAQERNSATARNSTVFERALPSSASHMRSYIWIEPHSSGWNRKRIFIHKIHDFTTLPSSPIHFLAISTSANFDPSS